MPYKHPRSTAKIMGHPIHPMLVLFPVAFLTSALFTDAAHWYSGAAVWAVASVWLLGAGIVTALIAAVAGFIDFLGSERIRAISDAWLHMIGNLIAVALAIVSLFLRLVYGIEAIVLPVGILLSIAIFLILLFTGWKGGEMVYRHGVGVENEGDPPNAQ